MLHLTKLAVGIRDSDHLRAVQTERVAREKRLRHRTRNFPRRHDEVLDGGSMYWVIGGFMLVRQRIVDIVEDHWDDGSKCAGLILDSRLVPLIARATKPFQGWRYLGAGDAPADRSREIRLTGLERLPPALRRELHALCLL